MLIGITGASGTIGKALVRKCEATTGFEPIKIARNLNSRKQQAGVRLTNYMVESLKEVLSDVDAVVHLAAVRGGNNSIEDYQINEVLVQNLLNACVDLNIKNVVYISSISVYSGAEMIPWRETDILAPMSMYGVSKLCGEAICNIYAQNYNMSIKSLRLAHVLSGEERNKYMINIFLDRASRYEEIIVKGRSIARREFIYVKDVADAILSALLYKESGVFNIGTGMAHTNLEIAKLINELFNNTGNLKYLDDEDEGINSSCMDISKAIELLGFKPSYSLREALKDIRDAYETRYSKGRIGR